MFSSASDAPRSRRPVDVVLGLLAVATVVVLTFPAPGPTSLDSLVTGLVQGLPGLVGWFWEISYDLLILWSLVLVVIALLAHRRRLLLRDELLAGALAVGFALLAGSLAGTGWSDSLGAITPPARPPSTWRCGWRWPPRWSSPPPPTWRGRSATWAGGWSGPGRWPGSRWGPASPSG